MEERLKNYRREYQKPLHYTEFPQKELDYKANIHNNSAKEFYEKCGSKVCEMSAECGSAPYELMRTKHCLKFAFDMCKSPKKLYLIDEKGKNIRFTLIAKIAKWLFQPVNTEIYKLFWSIQK